MANHPNRNNLNKILSELKSAFETETGVSIDFRKHVFLDNQYGGTPTFDYSFAEQIVEFTYRFLTEYLEEHESEFPEFGGWEYNLGMSCESLRTTPLNVFIKGLIQDMLNWRIA